MAPTKFVVQRGGRLASQLLVLLATQLDDVQTVLELAGSWDVEATDAERPWVVLTLDRSVFQAVLDVSLGGSERVGSSGGVLTAVAPQLPDDLWVTGIEIAADQAHAIEVSADPVGDGTALAESAVRRLTASGFDARVAEVDPMWNMARVEYATGNVGWEEVLDWDDVYSSEERRAVERALRMYVTVGSGTSMDALVAVGREISRVRRDYDAFLQQEGSICAGSGTDAGRMLAITGSDEWNIECGVCGAMWAGGSTFLPEHDRYR